MDVNVLSNLRTQDALRSGAFSAGHGSTAEQHLLDIFYKDLAALHGKTPEWYRSETVSYFCKSTTCNGNGTLMLTTGSP